jgi:hypothetical protein
VYNHIGWNTGVGREDFILPPEVADDLPNLPPQTINSSFAGWDHEQYTFYALWKYAQAFGGARAIFDRSKNNLESPPADSVLLEMPHIHNGFIAGYIGYLQLQTLAGYTESSAVRQELNRLLLLRANNFTHELPPRYLADYDLSYCRTLSVGRNFMFMAPELAQYLRQNALTRVTQAVAEYERVAPYWFVSKYDATILEGVIQPLYDYYGVFQAKSLILQESYGRLSPYLDAPAMPRGDLNYIHNLVSLIESASTLQR